MSNKGTKNTYLSTIESKKQSKQEQRQNCGYRDHFNGCQRGVECGGTGEEVRGSGSTNR